MPVTMTIIGAGRVGSALGKLALEAGYEIADVVCRSARSARRAAEFIGGGRPQAMTSSKPQAAHLWLIAVPDDVLAETAEAWAERLSGPGARHRVKSVAIHTSGALPAEVLDPLRTAGMAIGSCHPLQTFADPASGAALTPGSYFCIEGDARAISSARRLARAIGCRAFEIPAPARALYHAAAVMAGPGLTALFAASRDALMGCGLERKLAEKALAPLIQGTLANIRREGPALALTGPVPRGDLGTVRKNMASLAAVDKQWLEMYRILTLEGIRLTREALVLNQRKGRAKDATLNELQALLDIERSER